MNGWKCFASQEVEPVATTSVIVSPAQFFSNNMPTALNESAQAQAGLSAKSEVASESFPLSFAQESLWFVDQIAPGKPTYNMPEAWRLQGKLDVPALRRSLQAVVDRHESLRTVFKANDGMPTQVVLPELAVPMTVRDLSDHPGQKAELNRLLAQEAARPFALHEAPLLRTELIRLSEDEHILMLNFHHIISDAWSVGVFLRELMAGYESNVTGKPCVLPELPIQYADYAIWERETLRGQILEEQLAYWRKKLEGPITPLALPVDEVRPPIQSHNGATQFFTWPQELTEQLKDLARREGVTLFMVLLGAFKTLLQRYSRQDDIIVGSPLASRERPETSGLIGLLVNTLPLRSDLSGDPSFLELLKRIRQDTLEAYSHQDVPFEMLLKVVQPDRDLSRHPIFQVVFGLQSSFSEDWSLPGLTATKLELDSGTSKFDWTVLVTETRNGLDVRFEFNTDVFKADSIPRVAHNFRRLLQAVVAAPQKRISEFDILAPQEREQLLAWNQTNTAYESDCSIHTVFEARVKENPRAIALLFEGLEVSYGDLDARANLLAQRLKELGVGPNMLVGLCLERSIELIVAMLAILKAGGAYVPFDLTYPRERLTFMLADTKVALILTQQGLQGKIPDTAARVFRVDCQAGVENSGTIAQNDHQPTGAEDLAYVMFTSGSTGMPKGVAVPNRAVVRLVRNTNYVRFSQDEIFLQLAPISFDASTFEIWGALLNGAKLVIFPPHAPSLEELGRTLKEQNISTLWLTAGLFHQMIEHQLENLRGVRQLLAGGEALSVPHVTKAVRELKGTQLINGYGPTENTTFTCCYPVARDWAGGPSVPIGAPISNTQAYVLDLHLRPVPIGMPGELWAGGDGLARGYLNRAELTAERFVRSPFGDTSLYRTGDVARWLPDGTIEFLGRMDQQLKVRGYRVEPGEIEAAMVKHPAVAQAAVVGRSGEKQVGTQLIGYFVLQPGATVSIDAVREYLQAKLPAHMVPAHFVQLERLPLTANGKVDRRALPALKILESTRQIELPRNPTEERLLEIWTEVLGRNSLSIRDNFFHLGGHSLLATQVISRIAQQFQVELPVRTIFETPTIAGLAEAVSEAVQNHAAPPPVIIRTPRDNAKELLAHIDQLSEREVEELLHDLELQQV